MAFSSLTQEPKRVGFRAVVVSPTRELAQQTHREFVWLSAGSGFRVHVLTKAKASANTFGSQSSQRFGQLCVCVCVCWGVAQDVVTPIVPITLSCLWEINVRVAECSLC